jgi:hypothetical protein
MQGLSAFHKASRLSGFDPMKSFTITGTNVRFRFENGRLAAAVSHSAEC